MKLPNWIVEKLTTRMLAIIWEREPDQTIGGAEDPYMQRWYVIPRNRWANVYLHWIIRSDDDRALHDHPWASVSIMLGGQLAEFYAQRGTPMLGFREFQRGQLVWRGAKFSHRLWLRGNKTALTLFITGPRIRQWGFHCPKGWRHWKDFTAPGDSSRVGRGCD